jgi:hypothetical protein
LNGIGLASGQGFRGCRKTLTEKHEVSGHGFTVCGKILIEKHEAPGHGFRGGGKTLIEKLEVSGHGFSRAANASRVIGGLQPLRDVYQANCLNSSFFPQPVQSAAMSAKATRA